MTLRFGTDGIRGVANAELTVELVTALGRAAVRVLGDRAARSSSGATRVAPGPMLEAALVAGICAEGADVVLVGVIPTPGVAHLARERGAPGARDLGQPQPVRGQRREAVRARAGARSPSRSRSQVEPELRDLAMSDPEPAARRARRRRGERVPRRDRRVRRAPRRRARGPPPRRPARGARLRQRRVVPRRRPRAPRSSVPTVDVLNAAPDGTNINDGVRLHRPDASCSEPVLVAGADAGLAFDGDADRVIAVDERGGHRRRRPDARRRRARPPRPRSPARRRGRRRR